MIAFFTHNNFSCKNKIFLLNSIKNPHLSDVAISSKIIVLRNIISSLKTSKASLSPKYFSLMFVTEKQNKTVFTPSGMIAEISCIIITKAAFPPMVLFHGLFHYVEIKLELFGFCRFHVSFYSERVFFFTDELIARDVDIQGVWRRFRYKRRFDTKFCVDSGLNDFMIRLRINCGFEVKKFLGKTIKRGFYCCRGQLKNK